MEVENTVKNWIEEVLGEKLPNEPLKDSLKDGVILCNLVNRIMKVAESKFPVRSKIAFVQMENIVHFINAARELNVPDVENFLTVDLYEGKDMKQVLLCLTSLSRNLYKSGRTDLPVIGPKLAEGTKINFTQEQLDDAKRTISLQYGVMKSEKGPNN